MATIAGKWWEKFRDGRIKCVLCPRECIVKPGQRGFCFVRMGSEDGMLLTTYGKSSGFCIDPIEKKPLNHFYPGTPVLSFGTAGCNLGCQFCQNWNISKSKEMDELVSDASPEQIIKAAKKTGSKSVAFTYNDPVIFAEYAIDTAIAARESGIKSVAVTAGYITDKARADFFEHIDAANVDLKAFTDDFYKKVTFSSLDSIKETLLYLIHETKVWVEITTLLIPGLNDSESEIQEMTQWIHEKLNPNIPLHFSAFHPDFRMTDIQRTPKATLTKAREIAIKNGLNYVYTGNVHDPKGSSTYCPGCKMLIIERDWYELGIYKIKNGKCESCHTKIPGHFENQPGDWGSKRMPLYSLD